MPLFAARVDNDPGPTTAAIAAAAEGRVATAIRVAGESAPVAADVPRTVGAVDGPHPSAPEALKRFFDSLANTDGSAAEPAAAVRAWAAHAVRRVQLGYPDAGGRAEALPAAVANGHITSRVGLLTAPSQSSAPHGHNLLALKAERHAIARLVIADLMTGLRGEELPTRYA